MIFHSIWVLMLALVPVAPARQTPGDRTLTTGRFELRGPLENVVFESPSPAGARGRTRILATLDKGEIRRVEVPFDGSLATGAPRVETVEPGDGTASDAGDGRVEFLGFVDPVDGEDAWKGIPVGLRARRGPPVEAGVGSLRGMELAWLLACSGLVIGARRKPIRSLCIGLVGGAGALAMRIWIPVAPPPGSTVIEADLAAGAVLRVDAAFESLRLPDGARVLKIRTRPRGVPLDWTLDLTVPGLESSVCHAPGSVAVTSAYGGITPLPLTSAENGWVSLAEVWVRTSNGDWAAHGPWSTGRELPAALPGGGMPPGWLAAGLPPGRGVLIGRLAPVPRSATGLQPLGPASPIWLRAAGFE